MAARHARRKLGDLRPGSPFVSSDFFGVIVGVVEPGKRDGLVPFSRDDRDGVSWWPAGAEVLVKP